MKNINREEREEILKNPYMSADDIYKVLPVGKNKACQIFNEAYEDLRQKGVMLFDSRPRTIPTKEFKKRYL